MMFYKVTLTFLVIAALSVNVLAAPLRVRAEDDEQPRQLLRQKQRKKVDQLLLEDKQQKELREAQNHLLFQLRDRPDILRQARLMDKVGRERKEHLLPILPPYQPPPPQGE